jgi:hypothetical protein
MFYLGDAGKKDIHFRVIAQLIDINKDQPKLLIYVILDGLPTYLGSNFVLIPYTVPATLYY